MITVEEAEEIILSNTSDYGSEELAFENALGRILASPLSADRDLPPYDRVTMDGIAIQYTAFETGSRSFRVIGVQAAGDEPLAISEPEECIEIMTGAVMPTATDTIIRYEDIMMEKGMAFVKVDNIVRGQFVHYKGMDRKQGDMVAEAGAELTPAVISIAASIGAVTVSVKKNPRVLIISSGDELVDVGDKPKPFQIRRSNSYAVQAVLKRFGINASSQHIPDDKSRIEEELNRAMNNFDVIIISGGVSMGKFDYIPEALVGSGVEQLVYKVKQKPGKPFWFGRHPNGPVVFAFPGNPVSTFLCLHRYFVPWLNKCLGITKAPLWAVLDEEVVFNPGLKYFLPVKLVAGGSAQLIAHELTNNGSGDFSSLVDANAFLELPLEENVFKKGELFRAWPLTGAGIF